MLNLEIFRTYLESARHSIGHAMAHAAQGYTISAEQELLQAIAALDTARRMLDDKEAEPMPNGNAAAMREALVFLRDRELDLLEGNVRHCIGLTVFGLEHACRIMRGAIEYALAAPPRNCDTPLVVDGPANNDAGKAWIAFKHHKPDAYLDVPGLLWCIEWLLAPATEQKGGAN